MRTFTAYVEFDPEAELYVGVAPGVPGAHTQAASLDELRENPKEVLHLCDEPCDEVERANKETYDDDK